MITIHILYLTSKISNNNYIVEIDDIYHSHIPSNIFKNEIFLSGYVVDSDNKYLPIGQEFCFSIGKWPSDNILNVEPILSCIGYRIKVLDILKFPNWFERLLGKEAK